MKTELLTVAGMSCGGCTSKITNALRMVSGVSDVNISLTVNEATVRYDERLTSPEQLKVAVMNAGYSVGASDTTKKEQAKGCCCS